MDTKTFLYSNSLLLILILILILTSLSSLPITNAIPDCLNPNHTLSTLSTDSIYSWTSPSGDFAFGFQFKDQGNNNNVPQPLLAISLTKSPNQTIVWYAKPNRPVPVGSMTNITSNGVVILDPQGNVMWRRPKNDNLIASCASMKDDGNFMILDNNTNPIWESFSEPTDSLLPGLNLTKSQAITLQARKSDAIFSTGNFNLSWQGDGNLVLYFSSKSAYGSQQRAYWASGTNNVGSRLVFDKFGQIYIANDTTTISKITNGIPGSEEFYYVARLDSDGVFRLYNFRRNSGVGVDGGCSSGMNSLESIPDDICLITVDQKENFLCGLNSYCVSINQKHECKCPDHYSPFSLENDPNNLMNCRPDFPAPSCLNDGWEMNQDQIDFKEYPNLNWPFSDYDLQEGAIEKDMCKEICREDCFCAAVKYNKHGDVGQCWKKKYPLSNGRLSTQAENGTIALLKFRKLGSNNKKRSYLTLVLSFLLGGSVFFNILLLSGFLGVFLFLRKRKLLGQQPVTTLASSTVRSYTYKELEKATRGFKQILGRGGYGTVYKGVLPSDTRRYVAIKKLNKMIQEGDEDDDEFKTEVNVIGQTHHRNLVRLLGYCDEGEHRLLVYEYMSNGSLAGFLFGISRPHWNQRVQIALGIARGLTYLHQECSTQIIHCDIKPHNILLDELFTPRISDFGLVKQLLAEQTRVARTGLRGTIGYFAPEWFSKASITSKVDVYSFGVMLLELICCKSSVAFAVANEEQVLVDWAYDCYKLGKLTKLVENDEEARNDIMRVEKHVMIAIWCVQEDPSLRPSMKKVTHMLEDVTAVSLPPRPSLFTSSSSNSSFP